MKRKLWTGLVLGLLLALVCYGAATADDSGTCGANGNYLTWKLNESGVLTISGTGKMSDYDSASAPWDREKTSIVRSDFAGEWKKDGKAKRIAYIIIFAVVLTTIVTRTSLWYYAVIAVAVSIFIIDKKLLIKTDYILLLTFLCFFVFSLSIAHNESIAGFLSGAVEGREYLLGILLSQLISNVPAGIVLYPFAVNRGALLYGLDSAGLCTLIGSLASVINYRIYVREYPKKGMKFIIVFTLISLIFFAFVVVPGYFLSLRPL